VLRCKSGSGSSSSESDRGIRCNWTTSAHPPWVRDEHVSLRLGRVSTSASASVPRLRVDTARKSYGYRRRKRERHRLWLVVVGYDGTGAPLVLVWRVRSYTLLGTWLSSDLDHGLPGRRGIVTLGNDQLRFLVRPDTHIALP